MSSASLAMMDRGKSSTAPPDTASVNVHSHNLDTQQAAAESIIIMTMTIILGRHTPPLETIAARWQIKLTSYNLPYTHMHARTHYGTVRTT